MKLIFKCFAMFCKDRKINLCVRYCECIIELPSTVCSISRHTDGEGGYIFVCVYTLILSFVVVANS